ncbi:MAG: sigma-54-dependent Fis family transcriptional regulator [Fibrobacteres bacterium]|nr:sigma-54-dependent Fis family transcriptional regulator [Fibrobacterota bacterium]
MKMAEASIIPSELKNELFLLHFTTSKYIAVLYNRRGEAVWGANRETHKHKDFVDALCQNHISKFYNVPPTDDLNSLKHSGFAGAYSSINLTGYIGEAAEAHFGSREFPRYPSRNIGERQFTPYPFYISYPASFMGLFKISDEAFLGIVSFTAMFQELIQLSDPPIIITDLNGVISGANFSLFKILPEESGANILGSSILSLGDWNRSCLYEYAAMEKLRDVVSWSKEELPRVLLCEGDEPADIVEHAGGVRIKNSSKEKFTFIRCGREVRSDLGVFEIEITLFNEEKHFPGIVIGSGEYSQDETPDLQGYSLSFFSKERELVLKKSAERVLSIILSEAKYNGKLSVTLRRNINVFTILINENIVGQWRDSNNVPEPDKTSIFLFLRPAEETTLSRIVIRHNNIFENVRKNSEKPLTLSLQNRKKDKRIYNVTSSQKVIDSTNLVLYQFEDVTDVEKSIAVLKTERDRLKRMVPETILFDGRTPSILRLKEDVKALAATNLTVLIEGETGTGKDILARSIHLLGRKKRSPFIKIDCSTIPESLIESELFGHERGAFTGATASRQGCFEEAEDGTLFIDEIANVSMATQGKLLNVLQDRVVRKLGGNRTISVNARIIAASNQPLQRLISEGKFRGDLYYRLNQIKLYVPPLRERRDDIPFLTEIFIKEYADLYGKECPVITHDVLTALCKYNWPGNIRELKNAVSQAVLFAEKQELSLENFPLERKTEYIRSGKRGGLRKKVLLDRIQIVGAIENSNGNVARAAKVLRISRLKLYQLIEKEGIDISVYR